MFLLLRIRLFPVLRSAHLFCHTTLLLLTTACGRSRLPLPNNGKTIIKEVGCWPCNSELHSPMTLHREGQGTTYRILALYKFVTPKLEETSLRELQENLESFCISRQARGTLILSTEGINGTICFPSQALPSKSEIGDYDDVHDHFQSFFPGLRTRTSYSNRNVFPRLRIKIKSELITMGDSYIKMNPDIVIDPTACVGEYVPPGKEWDHLLKDPQCLVVDARNDYEVRLGTFHGAVNPGITSFTEFPEWLRSAATGIDTKSKIAMFCTGGIRCEKASAFAKQLFPDKPIYHLEGGILAYLDAIPEAQSTFEGECYVFDQRVAVTHGLQPTERYTPCYSCRRPLTLEDRSQASYQAGLSCPHCISDITERKRQRLEGRNKQIMLATRQGKLHIRDAKYYPQNLV